MATDAKYLHSRYDTEGQVNVDDEEYLCQVPEWANPQMQMGDAVGILSFTFFIFYSGNLVQI